jgi:hypothetical protein
VKAQLKVQLKVVLQIKAEALHDQQMIMMTMAVVVVKLVSVANIMK